MDLSKLPNLKKLPNQDEILGLSDGYIKSTKPRGGARPSAGRPSVANKAKTCTIRLTDDDFLKFLDLGGVEWLRLYLNGKVK